MTKLLPPKYRKMNPVDFFILEQPKKLQPLLKKLRYIILSSSPHIEEKIVYNIPFYYLHKRIFYVNPQNTFVELGFCNGFLISEYPILESKNRTQVKTISYNSLQDVDEEILMSILQEAILLNEWKNAKKKS